MEAQMSNLKDRSIIMIKLGSEVAGVHSLKHNDSYNHSPNSNMLTVIDADGDRHVYMFPNSFHIKYGADTPDSAKDESLHDALFDKAYSSDFVTWQLQSPEGHIFMVFNGRSRKSATDISILYLRCVESSPEDLYSVDKSDTDVAIYRSNVDDSPPTRVAELTQIPF
jgi:hypothetical protein